MLQECTGQVAYGLVWSPVEREKTFVPVDGCERQHRYIPSWVSINLIIKPDKSS